MHRKTVELDVRRRLLNRTLCAFVVAGITPVVPSSAEQSSSLKVRALALFKHKAVLEINGKRRTLKAGDESPEGIKLLDANSSRAVVQINGQRRDLKLNSKITTGHEKIKNTVQLFPGDGGHYFVDGLINGNSIRFLVDTGATTIAINKHMAKKIGLLYKVDGQKGFVETASGTATAYGVRFSTVQIRSIKLKNIPGTVIDGSFPSIALLGQSFLNRLNLRRDGLMMELSER